jgi:hypothetical protein
MARQIAKSCAGRTSRRLRKKVEMLFAHLKGILKLDRLRLRGPHGARDEFILAATAQNLRKLAKLIPMPNMQPASEQSRAVPPTLITIALPPSSIAAILLQQNRPLAALSTARRHVRCWVRTGLDHDGFIWSRLTRRRRAGQKRKGPEGVGA